MRIFAIQRVFGLFLLAFSLTLLPPMLVSVIYADTELVHFAEAFLAMLAAGLVFWWPVKNYRKEFRLRDGFLIVAMFWIVVGVAGALPFYMSRELDMSGTDAMFESLSGLTTTGATVITGLDHLPWSILYYRQQLQWLGGLGIIVIAVAIMPMLGIGGMQLYRAETPGPMKDTKLTPRITESAKALWYIYLTLTIACALAYWLAGMDLFDAISHSFSTIAIGGFSTHDANMGYFNNTPQIEAVAIVFMLLAGVNFALHFTAWRTRSLLSYLLDVEFRTYIGILSLIAVIASIYLYYMNIFIYPQRAILHGIFQAVSIGTTTGFTTQEYHNWPGFLPVLLLFTSFIGACAGSTTGGMKVIRFLLLLKQGAREVKRIIHPSGVIPIKIGKKPISDRVVDAVWGFFAAYVAVFVVILVLLMQTGLDQISAFSATTACLNNLGPGLNEVALSYEALSDPAKWILCFAMLVGRLEIFTVLVLLSPAFWRR